MPRYDELAEGGGGGWRRKWKRRKKGWRWRRSCTFVKIQRPHLAGGENTSFQQSPQLFWHPVWRLFLACVRVRVCPDGSGARRRIRVLACPDWGGARLMGSGPCMDWAGARDGSARALTELELAIGFGPRALHRVRSQTELEIARLELALDLGSGSVDAHREEVRSRCTLLKSRDHHLAGGE